MKQIIVTITNENHDYYYDIEIPVDLTGEKLLDDIVQTLNGYNPSLYLQIFNSELFCNRLKRKLEAEDTPEQIGIWNGDFITIKRKGQSYARDYI